MSDTDHSKPATAAAPTEPANVSSRPAAKPSRPRRSGRFLVLALIVLGLVLGAALYEQNRQYRVLQAQFAKQHSDNTALVEQARGQAAQALSQVQAQAGQIQSLRGSLSTLGAQVHELDQAMQLVSDSGSDLLLINDIDHLVTIAQQQLSLGGNVANALVSLEAAQAQLSRANRPNLAALQQSINGDLDRLRAVATVDLPGLTGQLDELSRLIGQAPLLVADLGADAATDSAAGSTSGASPVTTEAGNGSGWRAQLASAWGWAQAHAGALAHDFRGLFDVRRVDDAAALLMSPDQAMRFREDLKQRVVTAQLALMMHQSRIWKSELNQVAMAIDQRYDLRHESSRQALNLARSLHDTAIQMALPKLDNSLSAIAAARDAQAAQALSPDEDAESDVDHDDSSSQDPDSHAPDTAPQDLPVPAAPPVVPATPAAADAS